MKSTTRLDENEVKFGKNYILKPKSGIVFEKVELSKETQSSRDVDRGDLLLNTGGNYSNSVNFQADEPVGDLVNWGVDNLLPQAIMQTVVDNPITPGLIEFKALVTVSKGLICYQKKQGDKGMIREEVYDPEIEEWLEDIQINKYLRAAAGDANYLYNVFAEIITSKDGKRVTQLNRLDASFCRLLRLKKAIRVYKYWNRIGTKGLKDYTEIALLPDDLSQTKGKFAIHSRNYFTGFPHYGFPVWAGSLNWLRFANQIPSWKLAAISNGMSLKYHVQMPANYFQEVYPDSLINPDTNQAYNDQDRHEKELELRSKMEAWLTGSDNAHKTFFSRFGIGLDGKPLPGWKIEVLKDETNYSAYIEDFNTSNQAVTSAHLVDPSIASINTQGQLSSGSDKKHSYNILTNIVVNAIRDIVLEPINIAKRLHFPKKRQTKLDFQNIILVDASVDKSSTQEKNVDLNANPKQRNAQETS